MFCMFQVADQYAFIPREAVSRFLLYCTECQRYTKMYTQMYTHLQDKSPNLKLLSEAPPTLDPPQTCFHRGRGGDYWLFREGPKHLNCGIFFPCHHYWLVTHPVSGLRVGCA